MPTSRSRSALLRLVLLIGTGALVVPLMAAPSGAVPVDAPGVTAPDPAPNPHRSQRAVAALERVEDLLAGLGAPPALGHEPDLTLQLRELALLREALAPADRARAGQLLARPLRPAESRRACSAVVCVHWQTERQSRTDGVRSRRYVRKVLRTMTAVHRKYVAAGYRRPAGDGKRGGNRKPDVYLGDVGADGLYGYCTTDDPRPPLHGRTWGYCVLDNDYRRSQFPAHSPIQNMKVTAAHEYFHNVQFGHDIGEDGWFMEATATWAEDEVFDKINDNVFYLEHGPMGHPATPLDTYGSGEKLGLYHYGAWIFFRYLTDRYGTKVAGLDDLVLRMWRNASGRTRGKYSLAAVEKVLDATGIDLREEFAEFSAGNRRPGRTYAAETRETPRAYPSAPVAERIRLDPADGPATRNPEYRHLAARTYRFVPSGSGSRLTLDLALAAVGAAVVTTKRDGLPSTSQYLPGSGSRVIPLGYGDVDWVEVTLVNASDRFSCWRASSYSCAGHPLDDAVRQRVTAQVS